MKGTNMNRHPLGVIRVSSGYPQPVAVSVWRFCQTAWHRLGDRFIHGKRGGFSRRDAEGCHTGSDHGSPSVGNCSECHLCLLLSSQRLCVSARERLSHDSRSEPRGNRSQVSALARGLPPAGCCIEASRSVNGNDSTTGSGYPLKTRKRPPQENKILTAVSGTEFPRNQVFGRSRCEVV